MVKGQKRSGGTEELQNHKVRCRHPLQHGQTKDAKKTIRRASQRPEESTSNSTLKADGEQLQTRQTERVLGLSTIEGADGRQIKHAFLIKNHPGNPIEILAALEKPYAFRLCCCLVNKPCTNKVNKRIKKKKS